MRVDGTDFSRTSTAANHNPRYGIQERKLQQLLGLLHTLVPNGTENLAQRVESGELVTVGYDKLFAIASCVSAVQELVASTQKRITELEGRLTRPLRREPD